MAELIPIETVLDYADADMHIVSDAAKDYLKYNRDDEYVKMSELREKIGKRFGYPVEERIELLPTADVQPVKRGKWIYSETPEFGNPYGSYICSECNHRVAYKENYCPNCGARMVKDGEQND